MLDDESVDEIGTMSKIVNKNIVKTKKIIEEDQKVIEAVKDAVIIAKTGILNKKIHISTSNEALEELKVGFNELLDVVSTKVSDDLNKISEALEYYHNLDFRYQIDNASGEVASGLNSLAKTINQMLHDNNTNGIVLQNNSMELLNNVEQLSNSSNEAAESLKETAIALDEVTSNISQNTAKVLDMANYSSEVKRAVEKSEKLANQTTISMDEINEQVLLINESIIVIDKIAFQTNILSLNAAVEAATAGEAGKGFAVVAQEVRNLASRSAAAANEIKALVENATSKANDGKIITNTMVDGYKLLNESISKTITLILDVETSSKEQQIGIEHINNSIIQLDKQTQQNANVANETKNIATQTQDMANTIIEDVNKKKF
jgi:methyl-accepting chemotaxis protein